MKSFTRIRLTLRQKLLFGSGVNILFLAAIVLSTTLLLGGTVSSVRMIQDEASPLALTGIEVENSIHRMVMEIKAAAKSPTPSGLDEARRIRDELSRPVGNLMFLMEKDPEAMEALQSIDKGVNELYDIGFKIHKAKTYQEDTQASALMKTFAVQEEALLRQVAKMKESGLGKLGRALDDIASRSSGSMNLTVILGIFAIVLSFLIVTILSISIMKPMNNLLGLMKKAGHGDFTARYSNSGYIKCWEELNCDKQNCPAYGADDQRCWQVAGTCCEQESENGSETKEQDCEACRVYKSAAGDEFSAIGEAFNNMMAGLKNPLHLVRHVSKEIMSASQSLLSMLEELRHGSDQQSRSVDGFTSSIEEMNSTIKSMADNVESYYGSAEESNTSLLQMTASIEEVANSSEMLTGLVEKTTGLLDELSVSIREVAQHSGGLSEQVDQSSTALMEINSSVSQVAESARESSHMASYVTEKLQQKGETAIMRTSEAIKE
ncbi:MAG: hypothetical protein PVJ01_02790, partial [Pseudomonadota bacterium]